MKKCPKTATGKHLFESQKELCFENGCGYSKIHEHNYPDKCRLCGLFDNRLKRRK
jgi:hypothetical protein